MECFDLDTLVNDSINFPDLYFTPEYGRVCEISDLGKWEICLYKDLMYAYIKIPLKDSVKIITPYGYSGIYYKYESTLREFLPLFATKKSKENITEEIIKQSPYMDKNILSGFTIVKHKSTFGVDLSRYNLFEDYIKQSHKDNKRGLNIAIKNHLNSVICLNPNKADLLLFKQIYKQTMECLKADDYYFFNDDYFEALSAIPNLFYIHIYYDQTLIASAIIIPYKKYLHYHLGASLEHYRKYRPNNYMHCEVIKYGIENNYDLYHLGGGLQDNDGLYNFKKKISDTEFKYTIYKG